jgi:hypothetical protein
MRVRYQRGYLRLRQRKTGPDRWEFLWWDSEPSGVRVRRKAVIGTVLQYPNLENAWQASNGLRISINETRNRQPSRDLGVSRHISMTTYKRKPRAPCTFLSPCLDAKVPARNKNGKNPRSE